MTKRSDTNALRLATTLLALTGLLCAGCADDNPPSGGKTDAPQLVRVGYLPMISSLTYFIAKDQGWLPADLDIRPIQFKTSNAIADALESQQIDAAVELSVVPLLHKIGSAESVEDVTFRIFSTSMITKANGFDSIIVRNASPVRSLADLSGLKVAVFPGTTARSTLDDIFRSNESNHNRPTPIAMPMAPSLHLPALLKGDVDAIHAYEPSLSRGIVNHDCRIVHSSLYAEQVSPNPIGVAAIGKQFYIDHPAAAAKSIISALDRGAELMSTNDELARNIARRSTGISEAVSKVINFMPMSTSANVDAERLQQFSDKLHSIGVLKERVDVRGACLR